jgi:hypothetical protein
MPYGSPYAPAAGAGYLPDGAAPSGAEGAATGLNGADHSPWLAVKASAILLNRSVTPSFPLVYDAASNVLLDARDLNLGEKWGPRIDTHVRLSDDWGLASSFFMVNNWQASESLDNPGGLYVPVPVAGPTPLQFDTISMQYTSALYSGDVSLRQEVGDNLAFLIGFRYLKLQEDVLASGALTAGGTLSEEAKVNNNLYGFQIGTDVSFTGEGPFSLDGRIRAGLYGNSVTVGQTITGYGDFVGSLDAVSFVGEAALLPAYRFGEHLAIHGGYQALWLDGVALAPLHLDPTNGIHASRTAFYHGGEIGFDVAW